MSLFRRILGIGQLATWIYIAIVIYGFVSVS